MDEIIYQNARSKYELWRKSLHDKLLLQELDAMVDEDDKIIDAFGHNLTFGTAGLRGINGAGINRMNIYVVRRVTKALAKYILDCKKEKNGVVIAYDSRHFSYEYASEVVKVLLNYNIRTYLFKKMTPTPLLSYSIRKLSAVAGIVITASHNPPQYNGYKLYWENGSQITSVIADPLSDLIDAEAFDFSDTVGFDAQNDFFSFLNNEIFFSYKEDLHKHFLFTDIDLSKVKPIVYTGLNGVGPPFVQDILMEYRMPRLLGVDVQNIPDPDFTTVGKKPNPEMIEAYDLAVKIALKEDADIIIATDPDCDRVGIMERVRETKSFHLFSGNELGALLIDYIISKVGTLQLVLQKPFIVSTVVTGDIGRVIAEKNGIECFLTLTGFKNICGLSGKLLDDGYGFFLFGYEESGGYVTTDYVRDKDGIMIPLLIADMCYYHRNRGLSLLEALQEIFSIYGFYDDLLINIEDTERKRYDYVIGLINEWRSKKPVKLSGIEVVKVIDYLIDDTGLPKENLIKIYLKNDSWLAVRPSGTEPKLKIYICAKGSNSIDAKNKADLLCSTFRLS